MISTFDFSNPSDLSSSIDININSTSKPNIAMTGGGDYKDLAYLKAMRVVLGYQNVFELSIQETIGIVTEGFLGYLMLIYFTGRLHAVPEKALLYDSKQAAEKDSIEMLAKPETANKHPGTKTHSTSLSSERIDTPFYQNQPA
ncbi:hypothetical protein BGZ96_003871 [Linnemannia gamsii]|uniref:Uncharacterized protein n=1 Tax=Linnemannia gamsii TaxID=64522 RepID=A0ABQ7K8X8_9FUNG|nr:hypothetical protein BGZ96_003871 [Linnemannia gamsii]